MKISYLLLLLSCFLRIMHISMKGVIYIYIYTYVCVCVCERERERERERLIHDLFHISLGIILIPRPNISPKRNRVLNKYMLSGCVLIDTEISACRARIWNLLASERSERVTNFYSVEQTDIFQHQSYSHSGDIFIILKSTIYTDTSIFVSSREKIYDSKYASLKP
jgi:hypothetical protein